MAFDRYERYNNLHTKLTRRVPPNAHVDIRSLWRVVWRRGRLGQRLVRNRASVAAVDAARGSLDRRRARVRRSRSTVEVLGFRGHNSHETVSTYELGRARAWAERLRVRRVVRMYAQHRSMRPSTLAVARWPGRRSRWSACTVATAPFGAPAASAHRLASPHSRPASITLRLGLRGGE